MSVCGCGNEERLHEGNVQRFHHLVHKYVQRTLKLRMKMHELVIEAHQEHSIWNEFILGALKICNLPCEEVGEILWLLC